MATLKLIVESMASKLGQLDNFELKERLKLAFKELLALYIRRDIERNGSSVFFEAPFTVSLKIIDAYDDCGLDYDCKVLISNGTIPLPVRVKRDAPFTHVGSHDGKLILPFIPLESYNSWKHLPMIGKEPAYTLFRGSLMVLNTLKLEEVVIKAPYTNEEILVGCGDGSNCFTEDMEYPIPDDIIALVKDFVIERELKVLNPTPEIPIK